MYLECGICDKICNKEYQNEYCKWNTTEYCRSGCYCQDGYLRQNENGKCIPYDKCQEIINNQNNKKSKSSSSSESGSEPTNSQQKQETIIITSETKQETIIKTEN